MNDGDFLELAKAVQCDRTRGKDTLDDADTTLFFVDVGDDKVSFLQPFLRPQARRALGQPRWSKALPLLNLPCRITPDLQGCHPVRGLGALYGAHTVDAPRAIAWMSSADRHTTRRHGVGKIKKRGARARPGHQ